MRLAIAAAMVFAFGRVGASPPPPSFCDRNPSRCPALTKSERKRFTRLARTLERTAPAKRPYKRDVRTIGPAPYGYGRRGSAFPGWLIVQASHWIDPDPKKFSEHGGIEMTPLPVASVS